MVGADQVTLQEKYNVPTERKKLNKYRNIFTKYVNVGHTTSPLKVAGNLNNFATQYKGVFNGIIYEWIDDS